jgi:hypothetical protein
VAGALVFSQRLPASGQVPGADVTFTVAPTGELASSKSGALLRGPDMVPGSPAVTGTVQVTNPSAAALEVTPKLDVSTSNLTDSLMTRLTAKGTILAEGSVFALEFGSMRSFRLSSGESAELAVQAWLASVPADEYMGRVVDVSLTLESTPVGRR